MAIRITSISGFGFGLQWTEVPGDKDIARRVLAFLENRRVLFGDRHWEDEVDCIRSAIEIRNYLTQELGATRPDRSLATSLRAMRAACRKFVEAAGPNGVNFYSNRLYREADPFSLALGDLRTLVGVQVALIAFRYDIPVEDDLATIIPPPVSDDDSDDDADKSWIPGFTPPSGPLPSSIGEPIGEMEVDTPEAD
jgi:hypothetical protein